MATTIQRQTLEGDISDEFPSLSGKVQPPLPEHFSEIKKRRIAGHEEAFAAAWPRLLASLKHEVTELKKKGSDIIPNIDYADVVSGKISPSTLDSVRHRGNCVIRNVIPRDEALDLKAKTQAYIAANPQVKGYPADSPAIYELYWSPGQTAARAHPNMLVTQNFLANVWHSSDPSSQISTTYPLTYADRLRIRQPGDSKFALGPHSDGGSLERWEDPEYARVYQKIFEGRWEEYDPFDAKHRIDAKMVLYGGAAGCSAFRLFQGWLAMSDTGPGEGTLLVHPLLKHQTAYLIMRPFFDDEGNFKMDPSFPGSRQGRSQEYNPITHPHLEFEAAMVSMPRVAPGDYVAWHCDQIHAVDQQHGGKGDSSVLYIPACAMTPSNVKFMKEQRKAALALSPPQDYPSAFGPGEKGFEGAIDWSELSNDGRRAMGIGGHGWETYPGMSKGEKKVIEDANAALFETASA